MDISRAPQFDIQATSIGAAVVLKVHGDLDALSTPELAQAIRESLADERAALIVDLSELHFLGSAGMSMLIAGNEAVGSAQRFGVVADGPSTARPMKLLGLEGRLCSYPTLDAALADIDTPGLGHLVPARRSMERSRSTDGSSVVQCFAG
jgi:anti-sigma B factor antagonist